MAEKDNCSSPASIRSSISDPESEFKSESSSEDEEEMTSQIQPYMFEPRWAVRDSDDQIKVVISCSTHKIDQQETDG